MGLQLDKTPSQNHGQIANFQTHVPQGKSKMAGVGRQLVIKKMAKQRRGLAHALKGIGGSAADLIQLRNQASIASQGFGGDGQAFFQLFQPLHRRLQTTAGGKVAQGGIAETVSLVKNINGMLWRRQNSAAPQGQVGHHQIVVGNNAVSIFKLRPRSKKGALLNLAAAVTRALTAINRQCPPDVVINKLRPGVAVAVPVARRQTFIEFFKKIATDLVAVERFFILKKKKPGLTGIGSIEAKFKA